MDIAFTRQRLGVLRLVLARACRVGELQGGSVRPISAAMAGVLAIGIVIAGQVAGLAAPRRADISAVANNGARAPSLTLSVSTSGDPEVAAIGKGATLQYYTQVKGKWRRTQLAGKGTAQSGPSLVSESGSNAAVAVEGPGNSLLLFSTRHGHWVRQTIAGPNSAYSVPSLAQSPAGLAIAVEGQNNTLWFYWFASGKWHSKLVLPTLSAYSAPSLAIRTKHQADVQDPAGEADIAVEGADNGLMYAYSTSSYNMWAVLNVAPSAADYSTPSLVVVATEAHQTQGVADVAVEGPQHKVIGYAGFGGGFNSSTLSPMDTIYSAPSFVQNTADSENPAAIVFQGAKSRIYDEYPHLSLEFLIVPVGSVHADSAPAVFARAAHPAGEVDVIYEGPANTLWYFHAANPKSGQLKKFTGQEIGGAGSTFGG
jgi:hypothetical protein